MRSSNELPVLFISSHTKRFSYLFFLLFNRFLLHCFISTVIIIDIDIVLILILLPMIHNVLINYIKLINIPYIELLFILPIWECFHAENWFLFIPFWYDINVRLIEIVVFSNHSKHLVCDCNLNQELLQLSSKILAFSFSNCS